MKTKFVKIEVEKTVSRTLSETLIAEVPDFGPVAFEDAVTMPRRLSLGQHAMTE